MWQIQQTVIPPVSVNSHQGLRTILRLWEGHCCGLVRCLGNDTIFAGGVSCLCACMASSEFPRHQTLSVITCFWFKGIQRHIRCGFKPHNCLRKALLGCKLDLKWCCGAQTQTDWVSYIHSCETWSLFLLPQLRCLSWLCWRLLFQFVFFFFRTHYRVLYRAKRMWWQDAHTERLTGSIPQLGSRCCFHQSSCVRWQIFLSHNRLVFELSVYLTVGNPPWLVDVNHKTHIMGFSIQLQAQWGNSVNYPLFWSTLTNTYVTLCNRRWSCPEVAIRAAQKLLHDQNMMNYERKLALFQKSSFFVAVGWPFF